MRHSFHAQVRGDLRPSSAVTRRHVYECIGNEIRKELLENIQWLQRIDAHVDEHFGAPLRSFDAGYEVLRMPGDAGFQIDPARRVIQINQAGLDLLTREVVRYQPRPGKLTARGIKRVLVECYFLHEIRHLAQGLWEFADVQHVKRNVGTHAIGSLDLIADVQGARILAGLQTIRQGGPWEEYYLFCLLQNLVIIGEFAVKAFRAPLSKPHKVWRALGLACMAALIHHRLRERQPGHSGYVTFTSDCIIQPVFSEAMDSISLLALAPELKVLHPNVSIDPRQLASLAECVDEGKFLRSVVAMGHVLKRAGLIG